MSHIRCFDVVVKNAAGEVRLHDRQIAAAMAFALIAGDVSPPASGRPAW